MAVVHSQARAVSGGAAPLQTYACRTVVLHARGDAVDRRYARALLDDAERVASALSKLLRPPQSRSSRSVDLFLDACGANGDGVSACPGAESSERLAQAVTRLLVAQWFGSHAEFATTVVAGVAGLVAARTKLGPSVDEADRWVLRQIAAEEGERRPGVERVHAKWGLALGNIGSDPAGAVKEDRGFRMAATSFAAFLTAQFGPGALRRYLAAYDPARVDLAANKAFSQPLGVLEEAWLKGLRRSACSDDAMRSLIPQLRKELKPYLTRQIELLLLLIMAAALSVAPPILAGQIITLLKTHTAAGEHVPPQFAWMLFAFCGALALTVLVSLRRSCATAWLSQRVLSGMQERMYAHLTALSHEFYANARIGDLMERLSGDLQSVQQALAQVTNKGIFQLFKLAASAIALVVVAWRAPQLALPLLLLVPLFYLSYTALRARNKQAGREQRRRIAETASVVQESLSAQEVIKAFGIRRRVLGIYHARVMTQMRAALRLSLLSGLSDLSEESINSTALLFVYGVGGLLLLRCHTVGLGTIVTMAGLINNLFGPVASLAGIGQSLQQAAGSMERVRDLFETPISVIEMPGAPAVKPPVHSISLDRVSFSYDGRRPILRNLTMTIPAGSNVAIVGRSGGGKSTVARLLLRFWDPTEGQIRFDGQELRHVSISSLRGQIGPVFQDTFVFNTTVMENIRIGRPGATDAEVIEAAARAQLTRDISQFPAGYDTVLGERGGRMSGGQRQRLAIARVFLRNPSVLILDEATSSLDPETEAAVLETLAQLAQGRTTISIAHRLSWAVKADLVFVIDEGKLVEQGTHLELLQTGGVYRQLWDEYTRTT